MNDEITTARADNPPDPLAYPLDTPAPAAPLIPAITETLVATLARDILFIADGIDRDDEHLLPGMLSAYTTITGTPQCSTEDVRKDLAAWRFFHGRTPGADPEAIWRCWDGMVGVHTDRADNAAARRRIVLLVLNESGRSLRDLAAMVGVQHNAVNKAIQKARTDIASDRALADFYRDLR